MLHAETLDTLPRGCSQAQIVKAAWIEYRVTRQISTGNGERYLAQPDPSRGFVEYELGFACAPSIEYTLCHLRDTNRRNRAMLQRGDDDVLAEARKRISAKQRRTELVRKACRKAGIRVKGGVGVTRI